MKALVLASYDATNILKATNTLAEMVAEALKRENFSVDALIGRGAIRGNLPRKRYDIIFFAGHGEAKYLIGSDKRPIFDDANVSYCEGAIVVAVACWSSKWLSYSAVSKGARAYIGFHDLVYLPESSEGHTYQSDYLRSFALIVLALLEGYTVYQTFSEFQDLCREYAIEYETRRYDEYSGVMAAWMKFNANAMIIEGRPSTTLGEEALVVRIEEEGPELWYK